MGISAKDLGQQKDVSCSTTPKKSTPNYSVPQGMAGTQLMPELSHGDVTHGLGLILHLLTHQKNHTKIPPGGGRSLGTHPHQRCPSSKQALSHATEPSSCKGGGCWRVPPCSHHSC